MVEISRAIGDDFAAEGFSLPETLGEFRIHGVLGKGGMGVVLDATAPSGESVALKLMRPPGDSEKAKIIVQRFMREARILERLDHPSIVRLVGAGDFNGVLYLAMEKIEGVSLLQIRRKGPLAIEPLLTLGVRLADALAHMHKAGVIHRDIKPANILINVEGQPVITDFGISGSNEDSGITRQGDLLGSPGFMAPEVVEGELPSEASDQFALGRLLFELGATGSAQRIPVKAPIYEILEQSLRVDWSRLKKDGPWPEVERTLRKMLADAPADRYADLDEARDALGGIGQSALEFDTLNESIEGLRDVEPSNAWSEANAPADDENFPSSIRLSAPKRITGNDPVLDALDQPAGESSASEGDTQLDLPSFDLIRRSMQQAAGASDSSPDLPASGDASIYESEGRTVRAPAFKRPTPSKKFTIGVTDPSASESSDEGHAESRPSSVPPMPIEAIDHQRVTSNEVGLEHQVPKLQRQVSKLKEQLAERRRADLEKPKNPALVLVASTVLALLVGLGTGLLIPTGPPPTPQVVLTPPSSDEIRPPDHRYDTTRGTPSEIDIKEAHMMLTQASEYLAKQDLEGAERYLGLCVEIGDLPACHKTIASIYALSADPRARAHLEHYVRIAPSAPDTPGIAKALGID